MKITKRKTQADVVYACDLCKKEKTEEGEDISFTFSGHHLHKSCLKVKLTEILPQAEPVSSLPINVSILF